MKYQRAVAVRELEFWLAKKKKTNKNIWLTTALDSSTDADIDVPKKKKQKKQKQKQKHHTEASKLEQISFSWVNWIHCII